MTAAIVGVLVWAVALPSAGAHHRDATASYLAGAYDVVHVEAAHLRASRLSALRMESAIKRHCPDVLVDAPVRGQAPFDSEVLGALYAAIDAPDRQIQRWYARTLDQLQWPDRTLDRLVRAEAQREATTAALKVPNVCADAETWARSHFGAVPPDSQAFDRRFNAIFYGTETQPAIHRQLRRYENHFDRKLLDRIVKIEARVNEVLITTWLKIAHEARHSLGLTPLH